MVPEYRGDIRHFIRLPDMNRWVIPSLSCNYNVLFRWMCGHGNDITSVLGVEGLTVSLNAVHNTQSTSKVHQLLPVLDVSNVIPAIKGSVSVDPFEIEIT